MAKSYVGIDIGHDLLKIALVQDHTIKKTAIAKMPDHMIKNGRVVSVNTMGELIKDTMKSNGIRCNRAALVLSDENIFVRNVNMPVMSEKQLIYNLPYEFRDYITDELSNYIFDYAMYTEQEELLDLASSQSEWKNNEIEEDDDSPSKTMELLAVATPKTLMEELRTMMRKASLHLEIAAPVISSYTNLMREYVDGDCECCFLDLGFNSIRMYVFHNDRHVVTRELETGLFALDEIVADSFHVDIHLAHTYIESNYNDCLNSDSCKNVYNSIAIELMRAVNFYRFSNPESNLSSLYLCGGGAQIPALVDEIEQTLDLQIHSVSDLVTASEMITDIDTLIQAIGIAMN